MKPEVERLLERARELGDEKARLEGELQLVQERIAAVCDHTWKDGRRAIEPIHGVCLCCGGIEIVHQ